MAFINRTNLKMIVAITAIIKSKSVSLKKVSSWNIFNKKWTLKSVQKTFPGPPGPVAQYLICNFGLWSSDVSVVTFGLCGVLDRFLGDTASYNTSL